MTKKDNPNGTIHEKRVHNITDTFVHSHYLFFRGPSIFAYVVFPIVKFKVSSFIKILNTSFQI